MNRNLKIILFKSAAGRLIFKPFGYNKLLLAVIFLVLHGMSGFWLGFFVGCILDLQWISEADAKRKPDLIVHRFMLTAYIVQMSNLASAISFSELQNRLALYFTPVFLQSRMHFFNELLKQRIQVDAICAQLNMHDEEPEKIQFIRFLITLSQTSVPNANRTKAIYYVAAKLELDEETMQSFQKKDTPDPVSRQEKNYYAVLQVHENISYAELKRVYHSLAKQYHPDMNNNKQDEKKLNEKFREIKEAYEKIKIKRGWR